MAMFNYIKIVIYIISLFLENEARSILRRKRQINADEVPYGLPYRYNPTGDPSSTGLFPLWPFTHQYGSGLEIEPGTSTAISGDINVPIPGWNGIFDLAGKLNTRTSNYGLQLGHLVRPINPLNISLASLATLGRNPQFRAARLAAPEIPVAQLPYGFVPVRCRPPYCNPFIHNVGFGFTWEDNDDLAVEGELDFPIPAAASGIGVRFPLAGAFEYGTSPLAFTYGHAINPIDIFQNVGIDENRNQGPLIPRHQATQPFSPSRILPSQLFPSRRRP